MCILDISWDSKASVAIQKKCIYRSLVRREAYFMFLVFKLFRQLKDFKLELSLYFKVQVEHSHLCQILLELSRDIYVPVLRQITDRLQ